MSDPSSSPGKADPVQLSAPKRCYWETIPYEIRSQILDSIDGFTEAPTEPSQMPALVVALRPLPLSHEHVMEWFTNANYRIVHYASNEDGQDLSHMPRCELEAIRSINLIIDL